MSVTPVGNLEALRRQIAATQARFAAIGERLARAAEAIATTGTLPPEALLREVQDAAHEFHAVRVAVLDAAASLEVVPPTLPRDVASLRDLAPLMDTVVGAAEQAARRRQLDAARAAAFTVLNRVPAIAHRDDPLFAPLAACQDKALALRAAFAAADLSDVEAGTEAWWDALAPFAALLELLQGPDAADDTRWSDLEDIVAAAFGRRLATVAARGKLLLGLTASKSRP
jgi:hypothetical protein